MSSIPCPVTPVHDDWTVIRVALAGGVQAHVHPIAGVVVVDRHLDEDVVDAILVEASAGAAGDWARAPHAVGVDARPALRVLPGGAS